MRRNKLVALAAATAVFSGSAGVAFADTIYIEAATVSAAPGGTATFTVGLKAEGNGSSDPSGCNATTAKPVTISFASSTTSVAAAPTSVSLTSCDDPTTTAVVEGAQSVSVAVKSTAVSGTFTDLQASGAGGLVITNPGGQDKSLLNTDTIRVNVVGKLSQASLSVTGPASGTFGVTYPIATSGGSGTGGLSYTISGGCEAAGASSVKVISGSTDCTITATKAADGTYDSVTSAAAGVAVSKATQGTLTVTSPTSGTYGDLLSLTTTGGSGTGATSFQASGSACQITNGKLDILSGTGDCSLTATRASDANYLAATSAEHTVSIGKAAQPAVTMTSPSEGTFGDVITLTSSGGAGTGATSYVANGSACTILPAGTNQLKITGGTGNCSVTATNAADANYAAASSAAQPIAVSKAAQAGLAVDAASTGTFDTTLPLETTGGSGSGAVTYAVTGNACELVSGGLKITSGTGDCSVTATKAGDDDHNSTVSPAHQVTPGKAAATLSLGGLTVTYDGSAHAATVSTTPAGLQGVSFTYDNNVAAPSNAGSYTVIASLDNPDYAGSTSGTLSISPKSVTGAFTVTPKTYDGTTGAEVATSSFSGKVNDDDVSAVVTAATFDTKDVGTGKTVTGTVALTGTDVGNYTLSSTTATSTGTITAKALTGSFTANDKVYDGSPAAELRTSSLPGAISTDDVQLDITAIAFDSKNVGEAKSVTAQLALSGADAANYTLSAASGQATASITAKPVTGSFTLQGKQYDGTTNASLGTKDLPGIEAGDVVTLDLTDLAFDTKTVGTAKTAHATLSLSGADAGNYDLTVSNGSATAAITTKPVDGSFTALDKVYDGGTEAQVSNLTADGVIDGDAALLTVTAPSFDNASVGTAKTVTGAVALTGDDAGNYSVNTSATSTADITARTVVGSFTAHDREYDGTRTATVTPSLTNTVQGDDVALAVASPLFADKNVGAGKTVTGTLSLTGSTSGNYTLSSQSTSTATAGITAKGVTGTFTAANKMYDGSTAATITGGSVTGAVAGDTVTLNTSGATATFGTPTAGVDKTVTGSGFALAGTDAANYTLTSVATTKATITPWSFSGFRQPVDGSGVFNRAKAGSAIPVKFSLAGNKGLDIFAAGSPSSKQIACTNGAVVDDIEQTVTANASGLQYDATADQYNYVWKTSAWAGTCRQLTVTFKDGTSSTANFSFVK